MIATPRAVYCFWGREYNLGHTVEECIKSSYSDGDKSQDKVK